MHPFQIRIPWKFPKSTLLSSQKSFWYLQMKVISVQYILSLYNKLYILDTYMYLNQRTTPSILIIDLNYFKKA